MFSNVFKFIFINMSLSFVEWASYLASQQFPYIDSLVSTITQIYCFIFPTATNLT